MGGSGSMVEKTGPVVALNPAGFTSGRRPRPSVRLPRAAPVAGQLEKYTRHKVRKHRFYHGVCPDVADRRYDRPAIFFAIPIFSRDAAGLGNA
jgi:hypothetical protein